MNTLKAVQGLIQRRGGKGRLKPFSRIALKIYRGIVLLSPVNRFKKIARCEWNESDHVELCGSETRNDSKLILEAEKG